MRRFEEVLDKLGKVINIKTNLRGKSLLSVCKLNKSTAFSADEREEFRLLGKLPECVETIEQQSKRLYQQYLLKDTDLGRNLFLNQLRQNNETLFFHLVSEHLTKMLPIVYTPTIGDAVENFSYQFNATQGIYLAYPNRTRIKEILNERAYRDIQLIIVTDGEGVLGIGDWGIGGMDICIGKLIVYTLCGGINPRRVLPIMLDVGTNNEKLLEDPMYLGWRHHRVTGKDYDDYIDAVVSNIHEAFPNIYLHWEDFGRDNARKNLNRYRDKMTTFNDDMQGTGATALACFLAGINAAGSDYKEQRIVFFGAGTAGVGITDQLCSALMEHGLDEKTARQCFWLIDRPGLLIDDMPEVVDFQKPYARSRAELKSWQVSDPKNITLLDVVKNVKPTVLIGCSTVTGAFTEDVVKAMAKNCKHPLIFPISNPTSRSEAKPEDVVHWTDGQAIIATGSPFPEVEFKGKKIRISQLNNAFVFPGLGLGILAAQASRVTDAMICAAAHALSECSPALKDHQQPLLPSFDDVHAVSKKVALAVANQAREEGVATVAKELDLAKRIEAIFWLPEYIPYEYDGNLGQ